MESSDYFGGNHLEFRQFSWKLFVPNVFQENKSVSPNWTAGHWIPWDQQTSRRGYLGLYTCYDSIAESWIGKNCAMCFDQATNISLYFNFP